MFCEIARKLGPRGSGLACRVEGKFGAAAEEFSAELDEPQLGARLAKAMSPIGNTRFVTKFFMTDRNCKREALCKGLKLDSRFRGLSRTRAKI